MKKTRIEIEHSLNSRSKNIIWQLIGTASGLAKWIADTVEIKGNAAVFAWGDEWRHHEKRSATLLASVKFSHIRWSWDDEDDTYVEIRMERSAISDDYTLHITDFTTDDDADWLQAAWEHNFKRLYLSSGV